MELDDISPSGKALGAKLASEAAEAAFRIMGCKTPRIELIEQELKSIIEGCVLTLIDWMESYARQRGKKPPFGG